MNLVFEFDRRHGMATTVVGSVSGLFSWALAHAPEITSFAGMIGAICTAMIAALALGVKVYGHWCGLLLFIRRRRRNVEQRERHLEDEPFDDADL